MKNANAFRKKIHEFRVTGSTNEEAIRRAKEGGEEGEVFIADRQTAGRGRMGRPWESPAGKTLAVSILLRPELTVEQATGLTLVSAVALHQALLDVLPAPTHQKLKIKEPNDLYFGSRKLAGILTESSSSGPRLQWAVVGLGVNLNACADDFSPEIRAHATSLQIETGRNFDRDEILNRLLEHLEKNYRSFCRDGLASFAGYCRDYRWEIPS